MTSAPTVACAISFLGSLAIYVLTLMPGQAFGDWGEMQTVPHVLGVAHPTGYPTYILLAWLFELVPIGTVAFRANLLSAVLVSGALSVATVIGIRLGVRPMIAVAGALSLAAVGTIWAAATVAEVNPLHLFLAALLFHRALVWQERGRQRDLVVGGLLIGLGLGNHLLMVFVAPFIAAFVLWVRRSDIAARALMLVPAAGAVLFGLATYLYIPLAAAQSPPLPYNHPITFDAVLWLASGTQFRGQFSGILSTKGITTFVDALPSLWMLLVARGTVVLPLLGLGGLAILAWRRTAVGVMSIAIFVIGVYVWANYLRLEHYLLVPWLVLSLGATVALGTVADVLAAASRRLEFLSRRTGSFDLGHLVGPAALVLALGLVRGNWVAADRSGDRSGTTYAEAVFAALPPDAAILSEWDASTPLWYAQHVRRQRPDVLIVDDSNIVYEGWGTRERRAAALICERPVFYLRLSDADLGPAAAQYRLEPFLSVEVAGGGPSAALSRPIYRVLPLDDGGCRG